MKSVAFVILSYKHDDHVRIGLSYLQKAQFNFDHKIFVVDNHPDSELGRLIHSQYPDVEYILNEHNVGHPAGNNVGIQAAQQWAGANLGYVVILNPDVIIRNGDEINRMFSFMEDNPSIGVLGPRLHNPDGSVQASCFRPYSIFTPIYRRTILGKLPWAQEDMRNHLMTDFDHNETREVDWLLGAFLVVRAEVIAQVGMLDDRLFLYFGDYDYCDRAKAAGFDVVYYHEPTEIIHYHKRESASSRFSIAQLFSYVTQRHVRDWITYLRHRVTK